MKKIIVVIIFSLFIFSSCEDDVVSSLPNTNVSFNFTHNWDGVLIDNSDFNEIKYFNENRNELSIEKLRYLISDITFYKENGETIIIEGYKLVDLADNENLSYVTPLEIPVGFYSNVSFTFGFNNTDNIDGSYPDLNSASWNVPMMLGGGYHYMQLEGKFINSSAAEQGYQYHTIRAVDNSDSDNLVFQDTFFTVDLGQIIIHENSNIGVKMNVAEWFKTPYSWDLNIWNSMLMPNFDAQVKMYDNGQNVFSLGSIN